ncbi:hypothetical protein B9Z19DRAFT_1120423 [Tuber borchii]|uniref:Uncharacterized protein n=1 Tax=Tuber borchii TaxID=42251 RepID=A0A2T7A4M9_TUBBO|nr:hypothetical protein B9Z19DRAFT_1120423 [Tuber borchii]
MPALLDIKSRYSDDSAQNLTRKKQPKGRYSGLSTNVKTLISSHLENKKASTAGYPTRALFSYAGRPTW